MVTWLPWWFWPHSEGNQFVPVPPRKSTSFSSMSQSEQRNQAGYPFPQVAHPALFGRILVESLSKMELHRSWREEVESV